MRIDRHAADRIEYGAFGRTVRMAVVIVPMPMRVSHEAALVLYTLGGYIAGMAKDSKASTLKRLNRIEGQVRGLARMVEDDRYCIDIVTQIAAVRAALRKAEEEILRDHVAHCVEHAISSGDKADQRRKVAELMDVMGRAGR
jgi:DNA-binding FrmR family transcriptional regulator